ncbi:ubiquinol-cytochrome C chaperone family protein [Asticcacaulis sp. AC402]|uniref:ubiquinol-cytochrome C chaperone family protein n=1 Tax=Asticcacaulis sp. AC402 TaxID=1282361 RepID=UPI0003C40133|nr:ubiquinol-cytochrome C chaperone family protein [Asticcacaulis sp. AC402]ESQ75377.1 ubiquinol-cytochrome C chaperone [Asticcacaulis sp. AC402]
MSFLDSLSNFFKPRPVKAIGNQLYAACVAQARLPRFYLDYGVADEIGTRFELLTLHVVMVVTRLKSEKTEQADDTAQTLFDAFLLALDSTLREQGTGDLTVPKKMKKIGQVVYTRLAKWDGLWRDGAGRDVQAGYIARTVYAGDEDGDEVASDIAGRKAAALGLYVDEARAALKIDELVAGRISWPVPIALDEAA